MNREGLELTEIYSLLSLNRKSNHLSNKFGWPLPALMPPSSWQPGPAPVVWINELRLGRFITCQVRRFFYSIYSVSFLVDVPGQLGFPQCLSIGLSWYYKCRSPDARSGTIKPGWIRLSTFRLHWIFCTTSQWRNKECNFVAAPKILPFYCDSRTS